MKSVAPAGQMRDGAPFKVHDDSLGVETYVVVDGLLCVGQNFVEPKSIHGTTGVHRIICGRSV